MIPFSVVVPTYNRCSSLRRTIESLLTQSFGEYEIIIVDDGSTDETGSYLDHHPATERMRVVHQSNSGPAAARNAGINAARGSHIAFTDDDCAVPPDWLQRIVLAFRDDSLSFVGGRVRNCVYNMYAETSQEITNHFVEYYGKAGNPTSFLTSNNIAYRAEALRSAGGFDERFRGAGGEERELNFRLLEKGQKSILIPDLVVDHYHDLTLAGFLRQFRNYGRGACIMYSGVRGNRSAVPKRIPVTAYLGLLMALLSHGTPGSRLAKASLFFLSQLMAMIGYGQQMFSVWTSPR